MSPRKMCLAAASLFTLVAGIAVGGVPNACADFYKYTDNTGAVCLTNDRNAVPPQYRSTMKVVREETAEKKAPLLPKQPAKSSPAAAAPVEQVPAPAASPPSRIDGLTGRFPWLRPLAIVAGFVALFLVVARVSTLLPSPLLARAVYLAFFLGVFVFGYKVYADSMLEGYLTVKTKLLVMFTKANEREAPATGETPPGRSRGGQAGTVE